MKSKINKIIVLFIVTIMFAAFMSAHFNSYAEEYIDEETAKVLVKMPGIL